MLGQVSEKGVTQWLSGLSDEKLENVVSRLMKGHANEKTTMEYIECVKSMEHVVRFCSRGRRTGCAKCDYVKRLRHIVRWQKPGDWWKRYYHGVVMGALRFLNSN